MYKKILMLLCLLSANNTRAWGAWEFMKWALLPAITGKSSVSVQVASSKYQAIAYAKNNKTYIEMACDCQNKENLSIEKNDNSISIQFESDKRPVTLNISPQVLSLQVAVKTIASLKTPEGDLQWSIGEIPIICRNDSLLPSQVKITTCSYEIIDGKIKIAFDQK